MKISKIPGKFPKFPESFAPFTTLELPNNVITIMLSLRAGVPEGLWIKILWIQNQ